MAIAMTASLKDTVRRISVPLSVQCTSGALIGVSFGRSSPHITKSCTEGGCRCLYTPSCRELMFLATGPPA